MICFFHSYSRIDYNDIKILENRLSIFILQHQTYKIKYTNSSRYDMREMKKYILDTFKYRELGKNYTKKMKEATAGLKVMPAGFDTIGLRYRGYDIYLKPYKSYLFFYVVSEE